MNNGTQILNDKLLAILNSVSDFTPEIVLSALFIVIIVADLFLKSRSAKVIPWIALSGLVLTFITVVPQFYIEDVSLFGMMLQVNKVAAIFKTIFLIAGIFTILFSELSEVFNRDKKGVGEYYSVLIAILLGLNLMSMASNLIMVYLSIELVSIGSYILVTYNFNRSSAEAGVKYILFGAVSSGLMLYGMSLLYGLTGTLNFMDPAYTQAWQTINPIILYLSLFLVFAGFLFKISAVPFHIWAPDIYEGAPTPVVAFFSIAPKAAGFVVLLKFLGSFIHLNSSGENIIVSNIQIQEFLGVLILLTLTIGNFSALWQNNAKRMLAYSSIAHAGFILSGVFTLSASGLSSVLFYLPVYLLMNFGAFLLVDVYVNISGSEDVRNFKGLGIKFPLIGVIFVIIMIALTGLPPTAGFFAKFFVFSAVWEAYQNTGKQIFIIIFLFGLLNTVVSLFYYLKIPYYLFFKKVDKNLIKYPSNWVRILVSLVTIPLLVLFFKPDWLINLINR